MNKECISCEKGKLESILDFGKSPVANNLENNKKNSLKSKKIDLLLSICSECKHVQVANHVDQKEIFSNYLYTPSVSETLKNHLEGITNVLKNSYSLGSKSFVVDIGSNDGTFLNSVKKYSNKILGVDPATNLTKIANANGINSFNTFFGEEASELIVKKYGKADFIVTTNTFAHTPKITDFVKGLKNLLSENGVLIIEVHYLGSMLKESAFDTIYHEHFSYWSLTNIYKLFKKFNLELFDAQIINIHHGQLRVHISKSKKFKISDSVKEILKKEKNEINEIKIQEFCSNVEKIKKETIKLFNDIDKDNKKIVGYGAPAKASTMINFLGKTPIEKIYDKSKLKQGLYIPGTDIKIFDLKEIFHDKPDYIFIFSWNFSKEIINDLRNNYNYNGKFIIPIPSIKIY